MKSLSQLRQEADERRAEFDKTFNDLRDRLTAPHFANEALHHLDPNFSLLRPAFAAAKRNPLIATIVVAGTAWLWRHARQARSTVRLRSGKTIPGRKHHRIIVETAKQETTYDTR